MNTSKYIFGAELAAIKPVPLDERPATQLQIESDYVSYNRAKNRAYILLFVVFSLFLSTFTEWFSLIEISSLFLIGVRTILVLLLVFLALEIKYTALEFEPVTVSDLSRVSLWRKKKSGVDEYVTRVEELGRPLYVFEYSFLKEYADKRRTA